MAKRIGRFEIRRELGRGAQSVVYLAFDKHLEREVAVKTLHFSDEDARNNERLLAEARIVSPLRHAGIVPIFEAGEEAGDPYLVFEFVPGETLGALMRREGAMPAERAAGLMVQILDALVHAHGEGVIHRDLKPNNVLMDEQGKPRVMDFGIARRVGGDAGTDMLSGTPAYMAPEYIARREVSPRTDVFAAGVILIEMLTGRRLFQGNDVRQIMDRIASQDVTLPADAQIDERIAAIALRAVARDPDQRFRDAAEFRDALAAFLAPAEAETPAVSAQSTVDFLLRRMRHKSDFPALSESVSAINKIASSETESVSRLSVTILKDFSLTNKILRLVNSVHFRQAGGGTISTISRAIIVLGFEAVRNIAITVLLFEHLQDKANANYLKGEFLRANLAGILSKDIAAHLKARDVEQVFICAVFNNLGRLLSQFYFPEESEEIRALMTQKGLSETVASQRVLGIPFDELGMGIARSWGFPPIIIDSMQRLPDGEVPRAHSPAERLRNLSAYANALCATIAGTPAAERDKALARVVARFGDSVAVPRKELDQLIANSVEEVGDFARLIRVNLGQTPFGQSLRKFMAASDGTVNATVDLVTPSLADVALGSEPAVGLDTGDFPAEGEKAADAQAVLTAGIQDISNTLVEDFKLNDVLRIILETMYRAMGFNRVVLCIRDARANTMQGRFGLGPDASALAKMFQFPLSFTPDIFHAATSKGVDILISDIDEPNIAERIPAWFRKATAAKTFVVFPLNIKTKPVALIYAEKSRAGAIEISEKELQLLRTLRNQALLAIKQNG